MNKIINCSKCIFWKNHKTIEDIYPDMDMSIPIEWKLCNNEKVHLSFNMFLEDSELGEYIAEKTAEYIGYDNDGRFRKFPNFLYHVSENFGCIFGETNPKSFEKT